MLLTYTTCSSIVWPFQSPWILPGFFGFNVSLYQTCFPKDLQIIWPPNLSISSIPDEVTRNAFVLYFLYYIEKAEISDYCDLG
jgi:hypothetical protein